MATSAYRKGEAGGQESDNGRVEMPKDRDFFNMEQAMSRL
jgi:hypothetical protein